MGNSTSVGCSAEQAGFLDEEIPAFKATDKVSLRATMSSDQDYYVRIIPAFPTEG